MSAVDENKFKVFYAMLCASYLSWFTSRLIYEHIIYHDALSKLDFTEFLFSPLDQYTILDLICLSKIS